MSSLSPQLFAILSTLVEERIGIHYSHDDLRMFSDKLATRMVEAGFDSALDYYYYLRYDPASAAELDALIDALVVGETYFFRELDPLRVAVDHVLRPAIERSGKARVWSAACATGEEPLTVAMLAADAGILDRCEILGTDVSVRALSRARAGSFGTRSLRMVTEARDPLVNRIAQRWLSREDAAEGGRARVAPAIAGAVTYRRVNLLDASEIAALGTFDLVLCRNVLIYFSDETVQRVVSSLAAALAPEGRLVVGASESLLRFGTAFECEERGGAFFYARRR